MGKAGKEEAGEGRRRGMGCKEEEGDLRGEVRGEVVGEGRYMRRAGKEEAGEGRFSLTYGHETTASLDLRDLYMTVYIYDS